MNFAYAPSSASQNLSSRARKTVSHLSEGIGADVVLAVGGNRKHGGGSDIYTFPRPSKKSIPKVLFPWRTRMMIPLVDPTGNTTPKTAPMMTESASMDGGGDNGVTKPQVEVPCSKGDNSTLCPEPKETVS